METQQVIASLCEDAVAALERLLPMDRIKMIRPAETGLLMVTAIDAFQTNFYPGEMLVTEVEVAYEGASGYALLAGADGRRALLAAAVEAVLQAQDGLLSKQVAGFLARQEEKTLADQAQERKMLAMTRVDFETMKA